MFLMELRQAARYAFKHPGWFAAAVAILGLGIGVNSVMYSTVRGIVLAPLEEVFGDDRVIVQVLHGGEAKDFGRVSLADVFDLREQARTLGSVEAYSAFEAAWTGVSPAERLRASAVTSGFFEATRAAIAIGRGFRVEDGKPGAPKVAVISDALWRERFRASPKAIGQTMKLDGAECEIVGVAARRTWFPAPGTQVWMPRPVEGSRDSQPGREFIAIGVLAPGVGLAKVNQELAAVSARIAEANPDLGAGLAFRAARPIDALISKTDLTATTVLFVITGAVLLIACSNVANLLLAKAVSRRKELAVRSAIGASSGSLVRLAAAEGLVIAIPAGIAALLLAAWTGNLVLHQFTLQVMPPDTLVDGRLMLFTGAVALACVLLVSLAPALQAIRSNVAATLKSDAAAPGLSGIQRRFSRALVILQAACAVALLTFTGVAARAVSVFHRVDPGFPRENIAAAIIVSPGGTGEAETRRYHEELLRRLAATPGVESVGALSAIPSVQGDGTPARIEVGNGEAKREGDRPIAQYFVATPAALATLRIPILKGRALSAADTDKAPRAAVINEAMAAHFWAYDNPIGKRFRYRNQWTSVAGVYKNTRMADLRSSPEPQFIVPYAQNPVRALTYVVRSQAPDRILGDLRRTVAAFDPEQAATYTTLAADFRNDLRGTRTFLALLTVFACLAVVLTGAGLFALMAYTIRQRLREVGVHAAIGASPGKVAGMVIREGLQLTLMGLGLGSAAAYGLAKSTENLLLPVAAADFAIWAGAVTLILASAAAACLAPARYAARVSPMAILKAD